MKKRSFVVKYAVVSLLLSVVAGCAAADVEAPRSETAKEEGATTSQALMQAPGGGESGCGTSCSVTCTAGSCSASAGKGGEVCCSCSSDGQPHCN